MGNLKISEMDETSEINNNDYIPIIQGGLNKKIKFLYFNIVPIGSQVSFGGLTAPANWLMCDGRAVSRTEYAELFAVIGTNYGPGNGSTTFNLPDKRKRTSVGLDTSDTDFNSIGKKFGEKEHVLTVSELPEHKPSILLNSTDGSVSGSAVNWQPVNNGRFYSGDMFENVGENQAHNNMQPSEVDNWIIRAI